MKSAELSFCLALLLQTVVLSKDDKKDKWAKVKIVEAPALNRFPSMPSGNDKEPKRRADPSPLSGPSHLLQLHDHCYSSSYKGYLYKACLFNNITQKEERAGWNRFHGVLGVWHEWIIENDTFVGMHYTTGDQCGNSDREAKVMFRCSVKTELYNFTEPHTCSYHMVLDTPLACFTGAMQVYHLLSADQLRVWEELDQQYYDEELTYKGLTVRRRVILTEVGLLQKEKKKLLASPSPPPAHSHSRPTPSPSELSKCKEESKRLDSVLQTVKNMTLKTVVHSPDLHNKISAIFFFVMAQNASAFPLGSEVDIKQGTAATSSPHENADVANDHKEGMAIREQPHSEDRGPPHAAAKPVAERGTLEGGHRGHIQDDQRRGDEKHNGGQPGEQEALVDERELEQLVADIGGDQQNPNDVKDKESIRQPPEVHDEDIDNAINDLNLEDLV